MTMKATLLFRDATAGWSESYYLSDTTTRTDKQVSTELSGARAKVLGAGVYIQGCRISRVEIPKQTHLFKVGLEGQAREGDNIENGRKYSDSPYSCVLMPYRTGRGTKRYVTVSAFPDTWIERSAVNEELHLTAEGETRLGVFYDFLKSAPWSLQIRERLIDGANAPVSVKTIEQHTSGQYLITTLEPFVVLPGQRVVFTKIKGNNLVGLRGVRKVTDVPTTLTFTVDSGPRADLGLINYTKGGLVAKVAFGFVPALNTEEPYLLSTRKRGRPFGQRRGRRSKNR